MTAAAVPFARSGLRVSIDFSIAPAYVDAARKIPKEAPFDFVLLQPSLHVCIERAASREKGAITEYARVKAARIKNRCTLERLSGLRFKHAWRAGSRLHVRRMAAVH
jgi:hypothetical protein